MARRIKNRVVENRRLELKRQQEALKNIERIASRFTAHQSAYEKNDVFREPLESVADDLTITSAHGYPYYRAEFTYLSSNKFHNILRRLTDREFVAGNTAPPRILARGTVYDILEVSLWPNMGTMVSAISLSDTCVDMSPIERGLTMALVLAIAGGWR